MLFPRCKATLKPAVCRAPLAIQATGIARKVLVVDDSNAVRQVVVEQLRMLGYDTLEAGNAAEALVTINTDASVDLLLSDVVMPGEMQGLELAERVRGIRPDLKIVIMSGDLKGTEQEGASPDHGFSRLIKPVSVAQLSTALRAEFESDSVNTPETHHVLLYES